MLATGPVVGAEPASSTREMVGEFMGVIPPEAFSGVQSFSVGGVEVEASRFRQLGVKAQGFALGSKEIEAVALTAPGVVRVVIGKDVPPAAGVGLDVFHRASGTPLVSFADSDGDGALDFISYTTVDAEGRPLVQVTDYGADGEADIRIHLVERFFEVWYRGEWHRAETRAGKRGIALGDRFVELRNEKGRWLVAPDR